MVEPASHGPGSPMRREIVTRSKAVLEGVLPSRAFGLLRDVKNFDYQGHLREWSTCAAILLGGKPPSSSLRDRLTLIERSYAISQGIECSHTEDEVLEYIRTILALPAGGRGVVVEAGCFKGGSTAKFSLAADLVGRQLVVFDSFQGIPANTEPHDQNIFGGPAKFDEGDYRGTLDEVRANVSKYGAVGRCRFVPGWFDDTLPSFREPVAAAYIDVDLVSSTRTCLKHLYPLLEPGGALYSQDGHLPLVIEVFRDDRFWRDEVGCPRPRVHGLGKRRLIKIVKPR